MRHKIIRLVARIWVDIYFWWKCDSKDAYYKARIFMYRHLGV